MGQIFLKDILVEAHLYSYTIKELLDKILNFENKTLLFFDTETTGLEPNDSYNQLTDISVMAVDGSTMKVLGEFNTKVELGDAYQRLVSDPKSPEAVVYGKRRQRWLDKYKKEPMHPTDVLKMTHYHDSVTGSSKMSEPDALNKLESFVSRYKNVILIAHNARFDLKTIAARRNYHNLPIVDKRTTIDTVQLSRFFFIPVLLSLKGNRQAEEFLVSLLAKTKFKSYSSALGKLADVFKIKLDGWHQASEDVKMLFQVLQKLIEFLKENSNVDIRKQQGIQAKRFRNMK